MRFRGAGLCSVHRAGAAGAWWRRRGEFTKVVKVAIARPKHRDYALHGLGFGTPRNQAASNMRKPALSVCGTRSLESVFKPGEGEGLGSAVTENMCLWQSGSGAGALPQWMAMQTQPRCDVMAGAES